MQRSRNAVKDAILHHKIDNEALADALIKYAMHMMMRGTADYLRMNGFPEAGAFLAKDVTKHLEKIDALNLDYTNEELGPKLTEN